MDILEVLQSLLPLGSDWEITKVDLIEDLKRINIYVSYCPKDYKLAGVRYKIYDELPVREWQHLP